MESVTGLKEEWRSSSPEETAAWGRALGAALRDGDFVGLSGQLGAGKTLFCRAVAEGAQVPFDDVTSPTYAIIQSYAGRLPIHHADWYRLTSEADLHSTGFEDLLDGEGAFLVEWVDRIPGAAPADHLRLHLVADSQDSRVMSVEARGPTSLGLLHRWKQALASLVP